MKSGRFNTKINNGFTIVELLVVIVVIGILAAVTVFAYNGIKTRAEESTLSQDISGVSKQLETTKIQNNETYPSSSDAIKVSSGTSLQYTQLSNGLSYCATVTRGDLAFFTVPGSQKLYGSCPDHTTTLGAKYTLLDADWTASQIPTLLNGTVNTTLAGESMTISSSLSAGAGTGSHIDANEATGLALTQLRCYPVVELDGVPCPSNPSPDMQIASGRTLTVTADLVPAAYNSLSFLMSDVENNTVTVTAYDANNSVVTSTPWRVMSYDKAFDSIKGRNVSSSPADRPNPYNNSGSGVVLSPMTSQDDDAMRVSFDTATLARLKKLVISFTSTSTTDWVQWNILARHV